MESDDEIITIIIIRKESHDVGARKQQGAQHLHVSGKYFNSLHVQIRHGLMLLWFTDLMNVTEEVTIRLKISKLSLDFSFAGRRLRYIWVSIYIYIYICMYTHTHTHIHTYI